MGSHGNDVFATGVLVYYRHMAKIPANFVNRSSVICRVNQVVAVGYPGTGHLHKRDGHLTIV